MQGVRTTRGCLNCRRRKKGCDLKKPTCGRCQRLNTTCQFEERIYVFVDQQCRESTAKALTTSSELSLARTSLILQADDRFWTNYLPREDAVLDGSIGGVLSASWIPAVRNLAQRHADVRLAIQACVFAGLGWMSKDPGLVIRATGFYAQALRQTNLALQDPVNACSDAVLACCRLLSLFEMFRRSSSLVITGQSQVSDWQSHVDGTCRIVQLRGRQRHTSGHGVDLYDGVRMTAIIQGLMRRQPNAFTALSWDMPRRTLRDELFELISPAPELLQLHNQFCERVAKFEKHDLNHKVLLQGVNVLQRSLSICNDLRKWETKAIRLCAPTSVTKGTSVEGLSERAHQNHVLLHDVCKSHGHAFFSICAQYWAMCIIFHGSLISFHQCLQRCGEQLGLGNFAPQLPDWVSPEPAVFNIAEVASYFIRPEGGLWSAQSAVFPVSTALRYLMETGRKGSPAFEMMVHAFVTSETGVVMRDFLNGILQRR